MNHVIHGLILAKEREELLNKAKRCMVFFWEEKGTSRHQLGITNVDIKTKVWGIKKNTEVKDHLITITLERPGLLIGKGGKEINALQEQLTKEFEHPVKVLIIEDKQWVGIYAEELY